MSRLLALDVGNSRCKLGLFAGPELVASASLPSRPVLSWAQMREAAQRLLGEEGWPRWAALCSVVPGAAQAWRELLKAEGVLVLEVLGRHVQEAGLALRGAEPEGVGADRLVTALAAWARWRGPAVVVNAGTATVVDALSGEGEFLGGAIAPGVGMGLQALAAGTALLPEVEPGGAGEVIGKDSAEALRAGVIFGTVGAIKELAQRMRGVIGEGAKLVVTGGFAPLLCPHLAGEHIWAPHLTLEGIRLTWQAQAQMREERGREQVVGSAGG